jgi:hypothetical protein
MLAVEESCWWFVNTELEMMWDEAAMAPLSCDSAIFPDGLKITEIVPEDSESPCRDTLFHRK